MPLEGDGDAESERVTVGIGELLGVAEVDPIGDAVPDKKRDAEGPDREALTVTDSVAVRLSV